MRKLGMLVAAGMIAATSPPARASDRLAGDATACATVGPQAPRDIGSGLGTNAVRFTVAQDTRKMNLCNIHFHRAAEHKAAAFSIAASPSGFACSATPVAENAKAAASCTNVKVGSTIEFHWVYTSCSIDAPTRPAGGKEPPGLGACIPSGCADPRLRVEAQVFLVVDDASSEPTVDLTGFDYAEKGAGESYNQPKALPPSDQMPVVYRGSTTGPYSNEGNGCSPKQVTWSVRPSCAKVKLSSVDDWCRNNRYGETEGHVARPLVTDAARLGAIPVD